MATSDLPDPGDTPVSPRGGTRTLLIRLALVVFVATLAVYQPTTGWNVNTRLALVYAVVDEGRLSIDSYHDQPAYATSDKAFFDGRYYSDKTIGVSALATPLYAVMSTAARLLDVDLDPQLRQHVLTRWAVSLPAAIAAALMAHLLMVLGAPRRRAVIVTGGVFLGSMLFGYSTVFYPYLPGVAACLGALALMVRPGSSIRRAAAIGGLLGAALVFDLTFALVVAVIAARYAVLRWRDRRVLDVGVAAAAATVPLALFAWYCWSIFGSLTIPYRYEVVERFRVGMSQGLLGVTAPDPHRAWFLSVHPFRGILFWSPWILVALIAAARALRLRSERWIGVAAIVAFGGYFTMNTGYFEWWGGSAMGPRMMIPMFALLPLPLAFAAREGSRLWRPLAVTLALSVALCLPVSIVSPQASVGGVPARVLSELRVGDDVRLHVLETLGEFYTLRWTDMRGLQPQTIPVSLLGCLTVLAVGARWMLPSRRRAASDTNIHT